VTFLGWLGFWITFLIVDLIVEITLEYLGYSMKSSGAQMGSYCISAILTTIIAFCAVAAWEKLTAQNADPDDKAEQ
jgi:type III secretory pathway component EscR